MSDTQEKEKIEKLLSRGVDEVIFEENLKKRLLSGKKLRVKLGIDPTSPNIHLGRTVPLLKMKDFQELGHTPILIIGDFTGVIGDTSDKESERPMMEEKEIKENEKTYIEQVSKILDLNKVEIFHNSEWLEKLTYKEIGNHANQFSVSDFIARENIHKRLIAGKRVSLREILYPLMQGYDSVFVKADVELGGTDQRFNLLAGRKLQEYFDMEPQDIVMGPLIRGLDGRKMSSSWGNTINLNDAPDVMFGKIMSLKDDLMAEYFVTLTRIAPDEVQEIKNGLEDGKTNPRDIKVRLAYEIVKIYHSEKEAEKAKTEFNKVFKEGEIPSETLELQGKRGEKLVDILSRAPEEIISSKNEIRRLIKEGAIKDVEREIKIEDEQQAINQDTVLKVGKRRFIKIIVK